MAPPARLELTTLRLGGVRSIQVSYGGVCSNIVPKKTASVNEKPTHFSYVAAYNGKMILQGGKYMDKKDVHFDVDDYIFADQEWQPSEK